MTETVKEIRDNLYVDDLLTGADLPHKHDKAVSMCREAMDIMSQAGMQLAKWCSVQSVVTENSSISCSKQFNSELVKVLGISWNSDKDTFVFDNVLSCIDSVTCTKRSILSIIASIFDPLGFLAPLTMSVKILFQELWVLGIGWDTAVPELIQERFIRYIVEFWI